eukprot:1159370-Pelagomonas_calceolata.AAC.3
MTSSCADTSLRYLSGTLARPVPASTMNCRPSAHTSTWKEKVDTPVWGGRCNSIPGRCWHPP